MDYQDTKLNGWDYILAITEQQVNNGLRIAYNGNYKGPQLPPMPKGLVSIKLDPHGDRVFECTLGCPTVHAVRDGLNLCELVIPLSNAKVKSHSKPLTYPHHTSLRITTSLTSVEVKDIGTDTDKSDSKHKHHEVFVNFKDGNAVYNVNLDDEHQHPSPSTIANVLKTRLQKYTGREYRIGIFEVAVEADPFIPQLLDFSFVLNKKAPEKNAFLICGAIEADGPKVENRLAFESKILPDKVPAALWVGSQVVMGRLVMPLITGSLLNPKSSPDIKYDGRKLSLVSRIDLGIVQDHDTWMEEFNIEPSNGTLKIHVKLRIYKASGCYDACSDAYCHLSFAVSADNASFISCSTVDANNVSLIDNRPLIARIFADIFSLGLGELIIYEWEKEIRKGVAGASFSSLDAKLKDATAKITSAAQKIPAMEDLSAGGHLLFDNIALQDSGAVCVGIKRTQAA